MRVAISSLLGLVWLVAAPATAQVPAVFPVEGWASDPSGAPLDGPVAFTFRLYDRAIGGAPLHVEAFVVETTNGSFSAALGVDAPLDLMLFTADAPLYLGISIEGEPELSPRIVVGVAPFAAYADDAIDTAALGGVAASDLALLAHRHPWSSLTGIPASFAPSPHTHPFSDLRGVPASFPPDPHGVAWSELDGIPAEWADGDAFSGGDVTAVIATNGLSGGASAGDAMLSIGPDALVARHFAPRGVMGVDVDPSQIQRRIRSCVPPEVIVYVHPDGAVDCARPVRGPAADDVCSGTSNGSYNSCGDPLSRAARSIAFYDIAGDGLDTDQMTQVNGWSITWRP